MGNGDWPRTSVRGLMIACLIGVAYKYNTCCGKKTLPIIMDSQISVVRKDFEQESSKKVAYQTPKKPSCIVSTCVH